VKEPVFVLDYDSVSPLGIGKKAILHSLKTNYCAGSTITRFDTEGLPISTAAEIKDDLSNLYENEHEGIKITASYDRKLELLVAVTNLLKPRINYLSKFSSSRKGTILGIGIDIFDFKNTNNPITNYIKYPLMENLSKIHTQYGKFNSLMNPIDFATLYLANTVKAGAFQKSILTACAASSQAVAFGADAIRKGKTDIVIAGGSDSLLNIVAYSAFNKLGALAPQTDKPHKMCTPLDIRRKGTLLGEGASLIILASQKGVEQSGIDPIFEIRGWGNTLDGYKISAPDPKGIGMKNAMHNALLDAQTRTSAVDYINLHGTGTYANDAVELDSVINVFGNSAKNLMVSSTKDRHGHQISAAGIQEIIVLCLAMEHSFVPCTVNCEKPIYENGIDIVLNENRSVDLKNCLTNSFAFGGVNTSILFTKV